MENMDTATVNTAFKASDEVHSISRLFIIRDGEANGWTSSTRTSFILKLDNQFLQLVLKDGRNPFTYEVNTAVGRLLQEYKAEFGEHIAVYQRRDRYRFCFRRGMSGCQDAYLELDRGDGFPVRKHLLHESCFGKTEGFCLFLYDFLDLAVASEFLTLEKGLLPLDGGGFKEVKVYTYNSETDAQADLQMQVIKPRLTEYEDGWTDPDDRPTKVVPLRVCREKPSDADESADVGDIDEYGYVIMPEEDVTEEASSEGLPSDFLD